jgi:hypothetical protein
MMIYLVSDGEYSDYTVLGLYSTKEKAEEAQLLYTAEYIEEFELDAIPPHPPGELRWSVHMKDNGDVPFVHQFPAKDEYVPFESGRMLFEGRWPKTDGRFMYLWARDKEHAIKIASEKRREMIVSGEWYSND